MIFKQFTENYGSNWFALYVGDYEKYGSLSAVTANNEIDRFSISPTQEYEVYLPFRLELIK